MKFNKFLLGCTAVLAAGLMTTSCDLDTAPIDYFGSGSYWQNETQVKGYVDGLHSHLRDHAWNHTIVFGELRGGHFVDGVTCDGSTPYEGAIRQQNLTQDQSGVTNFGNVYGRITNCNLLISRVTDATYFSDENKKNYYLAIAYGLRAFYYFDLYRTYGGVPLRLGVEVIDGVLDPVKLYMPRANASEVMAQIKKDVEKSIELFGTSNSLDPYSLGSKVYWNKAASECLAAEVYLWNAKVATGDQAAVESDVDKAKTYLEHVRDNYGLSMLSSFTKVFDATNKANSEIVFAIRYLEGESTNNNGYFTYACTTGQTQASSYRADGTKWNDPLGLKSGYYMGYEYVKPLFNSFDKADTRLDATFLGSYRYNSDGELYLYGVHTVKNIGYINSSGDRIMCGDYIIYRLPWVYLSLAEVANMKGNNSDVEKYINLVRQRAYGDNWDATTYGYTAGDFTKNELAILTEKNKEFVQEGQRWYDLRRMTLTKGGKHLVFCTEASFDAWPVLDEATEAYKVLWPVNKAVHDNDSTILQTPGYPAFTN